MILTCEQLYNATQNPTINQLSLELLAEYYETYLIPEDFQFQGEVNNTEIQIHLKFDGENFCHLLGIESIVRKTVRTRDLKDYKGIRGWSRIKSGDLTLSMLREKRRRGEFNNKKDKYVFFYLLPHILHNPQAVLYDRTKVNGNTLIDSDIIFYNDKLSAYVHIGIKYDVDLGYYIPQSFFVERVKPTNDGKKYIENQDTITLHRIIQS